MSTALKIAAAGIRSISSVSPTLAGRFATPLFFSTRPRMRVREDDMATHAAAACETADVRGRPIVTYRWGTGTRAALLMHGWSGRASQFATLVRDLLAEGYRVHAFDAPAHGSSAGARTDVRDWIAAARLIADADGPLDLIVGHSFGAFAALAAVRGGIAAPRVVSIAGAGRVDAFFDEFGRTLRMPSRTRSSFEEAFHRRLGMSRAETASRFDSLADPLPSHTELLAIHDVDDRALSAQSSTDLHLAHGERSRLLLTHGFGHNRLLGSDAVLDAVLAFAAGGVRGVDAAGIGSGAVGTDTPAPR
ncbi:alpha/beta fold hydrolase [Microbacterium sp.]|uniref:alpha/beta hydrolase n=1 Tax=Microbacterium sp. TaxID=51671 RepID=UPI002810D99B|nr:alpha/beta fold hydrolase [Microbacterium sp.]